VSRIWWIFSAVVYILALTNDLISRQPGFYISLATLTTSFILYRLTQSTEMSGSHSWISSLIEKWTPSERIWEERNAIRTAAMEKAAEDRHLFLGARPNDTIDLLSQEYVPWAL
jgi:hypothetical protein